MFAIACGIGECFGYPVGCFAFYIFLVKAWPMYATGKTVKGHRPVLQIWQNVFGNLVVVVKHIALGNAILGPVNFAQVGKFQIVPANFAYLGFIFGVKQGFALFIFWWLYSFGML